MTYIELESTMETIFRLAVARSLVIWAPLNQENEKAVVTWDLLSREREKRKAVLNTLFCCR